MKKIALISLLAGLAAWASLATSEVKSLKIPEGKRTLSLLGEVSGGNSLYLAGQIERLSSESKDPIYLIINSPGGSVNAGLQVAQSLDMARARGTKVVCAVGFMAASMAFQLLPHCSERYALPNTLLLFHPSRVLIMMGALTADQASGLATDMKKIDTRGLKEISEMMKPKSQDWLNYNFKKETLWTATDLVAETSDGWLNIVDIIDAPGGIYKLMEEKRSSLDDKARFTTDESSSPFIIVNKK